MLRLTLKLVLICCISGTLTAQDYYWVKKADLQKNGLSEFEPVFCSEWLDVCSVRLTPSIANVIKKSGKYIQKSLEFEIKQHKSMDPRLLGYALEQVKGRAFIEKGLTGTGVKIGIIDGGFLGADESPNLIHIFSESKVLGYRDFITPDLEEYGGSSMLDDMHGTEVWHLIGGYQNEKDIQYGLATSASYILARTDHGAYEKRQEEHLLIEAIEWMHKQGVRVVNISLGYATGYLNERENYTPDQMDGKTSILARAIDTAFYAKNMIPVVAAGNEGDDKKWLYLSTPGDAAGAITVGATKLNIWEKLDYSSIGTPGLEYVKPDVACFATMGTSFSTPIVTGMVAGILQHDSTLSSKEIKELIVRSGHQYPYGNNYTGYGVPDCEKILKLLNDEKPKAPIVIKLEKRKLKYLIPEEIHYAIVYHKKGKEVIDREVLRPKRGKLKVKINKDASAMSIYYENEYIEVIRQ